MKTKNKKDCFWRIINMFEKLKKILVDEFQVNEEDIKPESELVNDLGVNSIELADLIMICEDKFGIEIDDEEIHKFITVGDVVAYLEANVK